MKKVYIQTFGCQMNVADSREMLLHLEAKSCVETLDLKEADIVLINTCTVREHAEHKALSFLGRLAAWKAKKEGRRVIFAGCAAERLGKSVRRKFPQADIIAGAKSIDNFSGVLERGGFWGGGIDNADYGGKDEILPHSDITANNPVDAPELVYGAAEAGAANNCVSALVNIMRGCSCKCSYCIVPYVRGTAYSIAPETIIKNIESRLDAGAKEIVLLGQTVNSYNYKGKNFTALLKEIVQIGRIKRIRYLSPHPSFIDGEFIDALGSISKLSRHIHLPVQSGSSKVLADMKRIYSREVFLDKVKMLASAGVYISTDIIVGYPTEDKRGFEDTLSLFDEAQFTAAYCFKFSPRVGTPAAVLPQLAEGEVEERLSILLNKVRLNAKAAYESQLGAEHEVLMETPYSGRTLSNFWVRTKDKYQPGDLVKLKIAGVKDTLLLA